MNNTHEVETKQCDEVDEVMQSHKHDGENGVVDQHLTADV